MLRHLVRTNLAADDAAFGCVFEVEDEQGVRGVRLGKELMGVAGERAGHQRGKRGGRGWLARCEAGAAAGAPTAAAAAAAGFAWRGRLPAQAPARAHPKRPLPYAAPPTPPHCAPPCRPPSGPPGVALKKNIMTLGPHVLPYWEQAMFAANLVARKVYGSKRVKTYVPSFTRAFEHVCIHTGE